MHTLSGAGANPVTDFLARADAAPESISLVSASAVVRAGDAASTVRRAAARLRRSGLRPGQVVAISAPPEWEALLTLAVMHEGAASLHASAPVLDECRGAIDLLLGEPPAGSSWPGRSIRVDGDFIASLGAVSATIEPRPLAADHLARVVFSSGTTGVPKGVPFTTELLRARIASARRHWMPQDPFFSMLGVDTVSGFQTFLWHALNGSTWIVPGTAEHNRDLIARIGVRAIKTSPARLADLIRACEGARTLPSLQIVQVAGAALTATLIDRCEAVLGVPPINLYGSTEGGTVTRGPATAAHPGNVGRPVAEAALRIIDEEGAPLAPGRVGVVEYRTPVTAPGYWRASESAATSFVCDWFRPGDRGMISDAGALVLDGRTSDVVNAGGAKVDLAAIDRFLGECDDVVDAAAFVFSDENGLSALGVAYVGAGHAISDLVHSRLRVRFPNLEVRAVVRVSRIPRTPSGKVQRLSLSAALEAS